MPSNNESSYGARLKNGNDMVSFTEGFQNYNPPREEEKPESMKALTGNIEALNANVAVNISLFRRAVKERQDIYTSDSNSVDLLLSPILKGVLAQYGKNSPEYVQVVTILKKFRSTRLIKPTTEGENGETEEHNSRSMRSFGSKAQFFKDIVSTLSQCEGYTSSNPSITLDNLNLFIVKLNESNNKVAVAFQQLNDVRKQRNTAYKDLSERAQRVKSYVASQYGINSNEYKLVSGLKI